MHIGQSECVLQGLIGGSCGALFVHIVGLPGISYVLFLLTFEAPFAEDFGVGLGTTRYATSFRLLP